MKDTEKLVKDTKKEIFSMFSETQLGLISQLINEQIDKMN